jgi:hypothetical protein
MAYFGVDKPCRHIKVGYVGHGCGSAHFAELVCNFDIMVPLAGRCRPKSTRSDRTKPAIAG